MIETRYTLIECILTAIDNNLTEDELYSMVQTECSFKRTNNLEYSCAVLMTRQYLKHS